MITLVFLLLGLLGIRTHWRSDRRSAVFLGTLFLTLSLGLVLYLNFKYGYSIARDRFPGSDMHEVRERDYFFMLGFSVWGLWAGMGLAAAWRWLAEAVDHALGTHRPGPARSRLRTTIPARWGLPSPRLLAAPVLALALLPLALNWSWASRADDWTARDWAYNVLMSVEPYGILVTNGDNDSFPLWYLQNVEGIREDVTIVLSPYLNTPWYARQIRDLTRPCPTGVSPGDHPTRIVCQRPFRPDRLPAPLKALGWATGVKPPGDSILGLTDEQIDRIAGGYYVTPRAMTFQAGGLMVTIPAGTPMSPADTFTAVILQAAAGERPIHFMPGSPHVSTLGLSDHTVRQGLTWRIDNGEPAFRGPAGRAAGVVALPKTGLSSMGGAAVDLVTTDTLLRHVFLRRGRILDPELQWTDPANTDIPYQYVVANYVLAQAFALRGDNAAAREGQRRGAWWEALVTGE